MESGLEGRNNLGLQRAEVMGGRVSMESGLEGRNNATWQPLGRWDAQVSMESGLEGRNNLLLLRHTAPAVFTSQWSPA